MKWFVSALGSMLLTTCSFDKGSRKDVGAAARVWFCSCLSFLTKAFGIACRRLRGGKEDGQMQEQQHSRHGESRTGVDPYPEYSDADDHAGIFL